MDKLNIIKSSIDQVRDVVDFCNISELPRAISELANNTSKNFTTSFIFSIESNPNAPTGGSLNTTTGLMVDLDEG